MVQTLNIKKEFVRKRDKLFQENHRQKDSFQFSVSYSLLVEEYILKLSLDEKFDFVLASAGSFSRRELSPFSDIDLMFITDSVETNKDKISNLVTKFWDNGLEASHTVREFSDIKKYLDTDLHTFTQFFETRFLLGKEPLYREWNRTLFSLISDDIKAKLIIV